MFSVSHVLHCQIFPLLILTSIVYFHKETVSLLIVYIAEVS